MYYRSSENKGADQLRGYREADLRLCFHLCRLLVFPWSGSNEKIKENWVLKQNNTSADELHLRYTFISSSRICRPLCTDYVIMTYFDDVRNSSKIILLFCVTALSLASYECEQPENSCDKERHKQLKYVIIP